MTVSGVATQNRKCPKCSGTKTTQVGMYWASGKSEFKCSCGHTWVENIQPKEPKVPMLEKMKSVKEDSQKLGEFIDWLEHEHLAIAHQDEYGELMPVYDSIEKLLARYFEIDLNQAEDEKLALLNYVREKNDAQGT